MSLISFDKNFFCGICTHLTDPDPQDWSVKDPDLSGTCMLRKECWRALSPHSSPPSTWPLWAISLQDNFNKHAWVIIPKPSYLVTFLSQ